MVTSGVHRGVSLYSFQEEYFLGTLTLERCVATAASLGALGIESIAEQMMPGFPNLPDSFYERWHGWMEQYGTTPTAHDMFLDTKRYKDRELSREEMIDSLRRDIDHAARLGCSVVRVQVITPPEIVEACAPYARESGVKLAVEVHAPRDFDDEWIRRHVDAAERAGTDVLGLIPDFSIYIRTFPRVVSERALRDGAAPDLVRRVVESYAEDGSLDRLLPGLDERSLHPAELALVRMGSRYRFSDPKRLADHLGLVHHVHAKFYEMTEDGTEYSIPYEELVPLLAAGGYGGYLSSEYEGAGYIEDAFEVDSVDQVRLQQEMLARLLGEPAAATGAAGAGAAGTARVVTSHQPQQAKGAVS